MNNVNRSFEPMDVDLSANSVKSMDISYNEIVEESDNIPDIPKVTSQNLYLTSNNIFHDSTPELGNIKKYHINLSKKRSYIGFSMHIIIILCALILSLIIYHINFKCSEELDTKNLKEILHKKIFGQSEAIDAIIDTLNTKASSKILFLYGGTGVGKTFAVSLILEKVHNFSNVHHYTMPSFTDKFSIETMYSISICSYSLLIVDDLNSTNMDISTYISDVITKSENLNKNITILLICNCDNIINNFVKKCDNTFIMELKEHFKHIKALKKFIKFDTLNEEHLRKCIENELDNRRVNEFEMMNFLKNFNVTLDGCKGVYNKIRFLNIV